MRMPSGHLRGGYHGDSPGLVHGGVYVDPEDTGMWTGFSDNEAAEHVAQQKPSWAKSLSPPPPPQMQVRHPLGASNRSARPSSDEESLQGGLYQYPADGQAPAVDVPLPQHLLGEGLCQSAGSRSVVPPLHSSENTPSPFRRPFEDLPQPGWTKDAHGGYNQASAVPPVPDERLWNGPQFAVDDNLAREREWHLHQEEEERRRLEEEEARRLSEEAEERQRLREAEERELRRKQAQKARLAAERDEEERLQAQRELAREMRRKQIEEAKHAATAAAAAEDEAKRKREEEERRLEEERLRQEEELRRQMALEQERQLQEEAQKMRRVWQQQQQEDYFQELKEATETGAPAERLPPNPPAAWQQSWQEEKRPQTKSSSQRKGSPGDKESKHQTLKAPQTTELRQQRRAEEEDDDEEPSDLDGLLHFGPKPARSVPRVEKSAHVRRVSTGMPANSRASSRGSVSSSSSGSTISSGRRAVAEEDEEEEEDDGLEFGDEKPSSKGMRGRGMPRGAGPSARSAAESPAGASRPVPPQPSSGGDARGPSKQSKASGAREEPAASADDFGQSCLYDVLGVKKDATVDDIRKAYKRCCVKHHPDKGGDRAKFDEVARAYKVLSDPHLRKVYDHRGDDGVAEVQAHMNAAAATGAAANSEAADAAKAEPVFTQCSVSLEMVFSGGEVEAPVVRIVACRSCNGAGLGPGGHYVQCQPCDGMGEYKQLVQLGPMMFEQVALCQVCAGKGKAVPPELLCETCGGEQLVEEQASVRFQIPPGVAPNERIVATGEGHQLPHMAAGDAVMVCKIEDHAHFIRKGDDLLAEQRAPLQVAICGGIVEVPHISGRMVLARLPRGAILAPGTLKCLPGEGMPKRHNPHLRGDLVLRFIIDFPQSIPEAMAANLDRVFRGCDSQSQDEHSVDSANEPCKDGEVYLADFDIQEFGRSLQARKEVHNSDCEDELDDSPHSHHHWRQYHHGYHGFGDYYYPPHMPQHGFAGADPGAVPCRQM
eukprot:TRINITY_DN101465_c0_g1_i1.p1 TRINITY_DN101465_c0_g1~~TRINITY_DN101465_c0_g1_i1.p1  ORF type:complete len:998 (-),score=265.96 TRINITY_DN101465_c0_g1_i1:128-3121(-)